MFVPSGRSDSFAASGRVCMRRITRDRDPELGFRVSGFRVSGFRGVCIYIYMYHMYA